jgi:hypothetical protein
VTGNSSERYAFFLGGHDLEMVTIRDLVAAENQRVVDKHLRWGAKASHYSEEIEAALARGEIPVLVELPNDLGVPEIDACDVIDRSPKKNLAMPIVVVDHHGERADLAKPTSLHQVFQLLNLPRERWTRWLDLVAANDRGHVREMRAIGASDEEIARVRAADRAAQGITAAEEAAGEQSIRNAQRFANGRLVVVHLPHGHSAVAADRFELSDEPPENIMVFGPSEVNFFGRGDLVQALDHRFPGGWYGGALPNRGFWGHPLPLDEPVRFLVEIIENPSMARATRGR